jgi:small subunit ribosomal protein S16
LLKIRLTRKGAKKKPFYRIVVTEERHARDGRFVQMLGYYNPRLDPIQLQVNLERVDYWISKGAKPTETVGHLLKMARKRKLAAPVETVTQQPVEPTRTEPPPEAAEATNTETAGETT